MLKILLTAVMALSATTAATVSLADADGPDFFSVTVWHQTTYSIFAKPLVQMPEKSVPFPQMWVGSGISDARMG